MNFNEFINDKRKQLNLSVDDLVKISGIPKGTLSKITAGINTNPTLSTIEALCKALNCSMDEAINHKNSTILNSLVENDAKKQKLIKNFELLNEDGQEDLLDYSEMLASNPRKIKESNNSVQMNA